MIGSILGRYLSWAFLKTILLIFLGVFILICSIDYLEMTRKLGDINGISYGLIFQLSLFRTPAIAEQVMPFAVLFGSMITLLQLSRKLELVIARAAGISAWQFLQPGLFVGFILGVFSICFFNPVSAYLKQKATSIEAEITSTDDTFFVSKNIWLRLPLPEGYAILQAKGALYNSPVLTGVTIFKFGSNSSFIERINAPKAILNNGLWTLEDAQVIGVENEPKVVSTYTLPSTLKPSQLSKSLISADTVPFWGLRDLIRITEKSGLDATRYRLQFASLIVQPFFFVAMVLVAASVSLRFFRFGGIAKLVLSGIFAGFVLYVATQLVQEFGSSGLLNPWVAAGTPVFVGSLLGTLALLYQEDG